MKICYGKQNALKVRRTLGLHRIALGENESSVKLNRRDLNKAFWSEQP